jgi:hypothetical protein
MPVYQRESGEEIEARARREGRALHAIQRETQGALVRRLECESCLKVIRRGTPRFGPSRVTCGFCGARLETGLTPWNSLSTSRKIIVALGEFISPSGLGGSIIGLVLPLFLAFIFCSIFLALSFSGDQSLAWVFCLAGLAIYLVLPPIQLIRMIAESNRFSDHGEVPIWKTRS